MRLASLASLSSRAAGLAAGLALAACGGSHDLSTPAECNPMGGLACVTPWPSAIYEADDASSPTGMRLAFAPGSLPTSSHDVPIDVATFNGRSGFSPATQIFTAFPVQVDDSNLVGQDDIASSLTDASPTVIVDMSTGERVPHWAELDANATDPTDQALYLRPIARLKGGTRYAVAIRKSLKAAGGGALPVPEGFDAILSGETTSHDLLETVRPRYDDIFAALATAGVPKDDLVVAWDFVTEDDDEILADTMAARDAALAAMGDKGANLSVQVTDNQSPDPDDPNIKRRILFTFDSPNLLVGDGESGFNRGADGKPSVDGTSPSHGVALIPACATSSTPAPILIYGHGFFGGLAEPEGAHVRRLANDLCMVVVGGEWRGMTTPDIGLAAKALNDANNIPFFGERIVQGIIDFIALEQLVRGKLATDVLVDIGGASVVDPTRVYFLGISQGSILGSTFVAWDPFITRSVHHVGGAEWSLLFERSTNWVSFRAILGNGYDGELVSVVIQQLLQMGFDDTDPVHVAPKVLNGGLPGTPAKQLLHQMTIGDAQVSNLASELQARTMGLQIVPTALEVPYGLTEGSGALSSGLSMWTIEPSPLPPTSNLLNDTDNGAHGETRKYAAVVQQMQTFFETGDIVTTCTGGVCDCATGHCGPIGD